MLGHTLPYVALDQVVDAALSRRQLRGLQVHRVERFRLRLADCRLLHRDGGICFDNVAPTARGMAEYTYTNRLQRRVCRVC